MPSPERGPGAHGLGEHGPGEHGLREAFDYEFSRLDPTGAHIDPPSVAIYEPLMAKGPDWTAQPCLAESWAVSDDGLSWRVRMRPGARFHSGNPCGTEAVAAALEHLRHQSGTERQLWYWDPVDSVETDGPQSLVFRLKFPYSRLPSLLWGTHTAVYNEYARQKDPDRFGRVLADGTGPYRLTYWSPERVVAERWDGYRGPSGGILSTSGRSAPSIEWVSVLSAADRLAALDRRDVDCIHGPPYEASAALREDPRFRVHEQCQQSNIYLALDFRRTELGFDDRRVRRGISMAIDRTALVATALSGHGSVTYGPLPPGMSFTTRLWRRAGAAIRGERERSSTRLVGAWTEERSAAAESMNCASSAWSRTTRSSRKWPSSCDLRWPTSACSSNYVWPSPSPTFTRPVLEGRPPPYQNGCGPTRSTQ